MSDEKEAPTVKQYEDFLFEPVTRRWEIFLALNESGQYTPLEIAEAIPAIEKAILGGATLAAFTGGKAAKARGGNDAA